MRTHGEPSVHSAVTRELISSQAAAALVDMSAAGAIVTFSGDVRDHDHGRSVAGLDYEGHPTAAEVLGEVAREVAARHDILGLAVMHRIGPLQIGDCALAAAVSSAHRGAAFAACADLVDTTKERLPVWKHQVFADGTDEWVNCA